MKLSHLFIFSLIIALFSTCETEVDITSEYERIPVVYGLLDQSTEKQIFLINRTFLGSGNAVELAMVEDSMLFDEVDASVEWYNSSGTLIGSASLVDTLLEDKDVNGIFYSPTAKAYVVDSEDIWSNWPNHNPSVYYDYEYRLNIIADGQTITSQTMVSSTYGNGSGAIQQPVPSNMNSINLVTSFNPDGSTYNGNFRVVWNEGTNDVRNAVKQKLDVRFNYREVYMDGSFEDKSVTFPYITKDVDVPGQEVDESRSGEFFFSSIANGIDLSTPDVRYREIGTFDFILTVAEEDFTTYLNIGENTVSEVGQSRPSFSNINDGDALGIFSSRDQYVRAKPLYTNGSEADLREMVDGQYTRDYCFCDPTGISSQYTCADSNNHCQ